MTVIEWFRTMFRLTYQLVIYCKVKGNLSVLYSLLWGEIYIIFSDCFVVSFRMLVLKLSSDFAMYWGLVLCVCVCYGSVESMDNLRSLAKWTWAPLALLFAFSPPDLGAALSTPNNSLSPPFLVLFVPFWLYFSLPFNFSDLCPKYNNLIQFLSLLIILISCFQPTGGVLWWWYHFAWRDIYIYILVVCWQHRRYVIA